MQPRVYLVIILFLLNDIVMSTDKYDENGMKTYGPASDSNQERVMTGNAQHTADTGAGKQAGETAVTCEYCANEFNKRGGCENFNAHTKPKAFLPSTCYSMVRHCAGHVLGLCSVPSAGGTAVPSAGGHAGHAASGTAGHAASGTETTRTN